MVQSKKACQEEGSYTCTSLLNYLPSISGWEMGGDSMQTRRWLTVTIALFHCFFFRIFSLFTYTLSVKKAFCYLNAVNSKTFLGPGLSTLSRLSVGIGL